MSGIELFAWQYPLAECVDQSKLKRLLFKSTRNWICELLPFVLKTILWAHFFFAFNVNWDLLSVGTNSAWLFAAFLLIITVSPLVSLRNYQSVTPPHCHLPCLPAGVKQSKTRRSWKERKEEEENDGGRAMGGNSCLRKLSMSNSKPPVNFGISLSKSCILTQNKYFGKFQKIYYISNTIIIHNKLQGWSTRISVAYDV